MRRAERAIRRGVRAMTGRPGRRAPVPGPRAWRVALASLLLLVGLSALSPAQDQAPAPAAPPVTPGPYAPNLAIISIEGPIDAMTSRSFERRLDRAIEQGADGVVVDLDTPGGEVGAVREICSMIKRSPLTVIAWVNPIAYSGGAIIALACDEIVVATSAYMGDAAPVVFDPIQGIANIEDPLERQKVLAPLLAEIVDSARLRGYDEVLVQGLVSLGVETWQVEDTRSGRMHFLTEEEYRQLFGEAPTRGAPAIPSGGESPFDDPAPVAPDAGEPIDESVGFTPAAPEFGPSLATEVAQSLTETSRRPDFSREDPADYRLVGYATDGKTLLTMSESQMRDFGFVGYDQAIDTDEQMQAYTGAQNLARLNMTWAERMVAFMTQGVSGLIIRAVLIVVFLLAIFLELTMPGVGLPGIVALVALAGIVVPPMLAGAATWWALAAILAGVGLILLELLVIPGFGVPGVAGLALMLAGLVGSFAQAGELFPGQGAGGASDLAWAVSSVILAFFAAGVGVYFLSKYTRSIPIASKIVLFDQQPAGDSPAPSLLGAMSPETAGEGPGVAVGQVGLATTPLRPSGTAEFDGRLVDVVSELGFVEAGERVRVVNTAGFRVGVERDAGDGATGGTA